jgi:predicted nucleic acid-binding protein
MGVFVDTSAWYALLDRTDAEHPAIVDQLRPLHDRQVSDSMLETALGWGDGAA